MHGCYSMCYELLDTQGLTLTTPAAAGGGEGRLMGEFGLLWTQMYAVSIRNLRGKSQNEKLDINPINYNI